VKIPPVVAVPPMLTDFKDLDAGRCIIATQIPGKHWEWCGPLDGQRHTLAVMNRLGIRTAQMKLADGRYALIGWWTPSKPKIRRF
jgi:hypothetical protein